MSPAASVASPQPTPREIRSVLVANRGEVVLRIARTLSRRLMRSVAIYTPQDRHAPHVRAADHSYSVPDYLDVPAIVEAARRAGADAVHPGYGFLSEDPSFARAVLHAGLVWIGPPPEAMEIMGDKIRAKETVAAAGVPVVPGVGDAAVCDAAVRDADLLEAARELGFPLLLKPSAGGGGKGMHLVERAEDLAPALERARREALGAFGDATMLIERFIPRPRHIEIQIFCDMHGNAVHLGTRECSLQRRHQKIVEETPSPAIDEQTRDAITARALDAARACGYVGAGTVEFIVSSDRPTEFSFMEMNTRLQVEHAITEVVTGIDLVDWQLRVAAGECLPLGQGDIAFRGHGVEARVYAEDPARGFLPATGRVLRVTQPASSKGIRVDAALEPGLVVGSRYDPMLAKVIAWGETRKEAIGRLRKALASTTILGVTTNVGYLTRLLGHPDVEAGTIDTGLVERTVGELSVPGESCEELAAIAATCRMGLDLESTPERSDPWDTPDSWRLGGGGPSTAHWRVTLRRPGGATEGRTLSVQGRLSGAATVALGTGMARAVAASWIGAPDTAMSVTVDGETTEWLTAATLDTVWVANAGQTWCFSTASTPRSPLAEHDQGTSTVRSPMPGVAVEVRVAEGEAVREGQTLVVVEAMKMEHSVVAPSDGVVRHVWAREGRPVAVDEVLAEVTPR